MHPRLALLAAVSLLVAPDDVTKDSAKKELEKLQGTWVLVGAEEKGHVLTEAEAKAEDQTLLIKGDKLTLLRGKHHDTCTIRLDPSKKPAWMDLIFDGDKANHAIYSLEGDKLTICVSYKYGPNKKGSS
jgi:uncharacterized protein (TIGR03067 family)